MSGETEIEVSVVSEEDLDLETSRGSPTTPGDMLLQDGKNGKSGCLTSTNPFGFDVVGGKATLRPVCNPQYTSFSISSILGRTESPPSDSASAGRASPLANNRHGCGSPRNSSTKTTAAATASDGGPGVTTSGSSNATSPMTVASFANSEAAAAAAAGGLIGHQASADLTMLSR